MAPKQQGTHFKCTWNFHQVRPQSPKPDVAPLLKQPNVLEKGTQPGRRTAPGNARVGSRPPRRRSPREPLPAPRPSGACLAHVDALSVSVLHLEHPHPGSSPPSASPPCPLGLCACHSPHTHHPPSSCPRANCPSAAPPHPRIYSGRGWSLGTYGVFLCGPPGPGLSEGRAR